MNHPLQVKIDSEAGAGYVTYPRLARGEHVARTERIGGDVVVDYDATGNVLGIEVLAFDNVSAYGRPNFCTRARFDGPDTTGVIEHLSACVSCVARRLE